MSNPDNSQYFFELTKANGYSQNIILPYTLIKPFVRFQSTSNIVIKTNVVSNSDVYFVGLDGNTTLKNEFGIITTSSNDLKRVSNRNINNIEVSLYFPKPEETNSSYDVLLIFTDGNV